MLPYEAHADPNLLLQSLARRGLSLELQTLDVCFLAALHLRADSSALAAFSEEQLEAVFDEVAGVVGAGTEVRPRAGYAIRRLREQRLLARVDGAGVLRKGEFALTRLASGIVLFFLEDETLTRESLTVLTTTLHASLVAITLTAGSIRAPDAWRAQVVVPLRVTVAELVGGIQRRQRGFDVQQEALQREIGELLSADWFGALARCESLLDATTATLGELNSMLLQGTSQLQATLQELQELAMTAVAEEAETAVRQLIDQIDRIAAWGAARQRAWSDYHQYVHRFLREVVRLDPARVLTHRLGDLLGGRAGLSLSLAVAAAPSIRLLRAVTPPAELKPEVKRRKPPAERPLDVVAADDPQARLDEEVRSAIASGASGLVAITMQLTARMEPRERFVAAGRIANTVARVSTPHAAADRPWVQVDDAFQIEEWKERKTQ